MEVHPVHGPVHNLRDFFVHLSIITVGLLIALGLEGLVEWGRHRQLEHRVEADLRAELQVNQTLLASNTKSLDTAEKQAETDLDILLTYRAKHHGAGELKFYWEWSSLSSAAWDTARDTGGVALMNYEKAQKYSEAYGQQLLVNAQAAAYIRDVYRSAAPLEGGRHVSELQPAELDTLIGNVQQTMADLNFLRDLSQGLSREFAQMPANSH
jgi:hypothetical protein